MQVTQGFSQGGDGDVTAFYIHLWDGWDGWNPKHILLQSRNSDLVAELQDPQ